MRDPGLVQRRQTWSGRGGNRTRSFLRAPAFAFFQSRHCVALRGARRSSRRTVFIHRVGRLRAFQESRAFLGLVLLVPAASQALELARVAHVRDVKPAEVGAAGFRRGGPGVPPMRSRGASRRRVPPPAEVSPALRSRLRARRTRRPDLLAPEDGILRESVVVEIRSVLQIAVRIVAVSENARATAPRGGDENRVSARGVVPAAVCRFSRFRVRGDFRGDSRVVRAAAAEVEPRARSGWRRRARGIRRESVVDGSRAVLETLDETLVRLDFGYGTGRRFTCRAARVRVARSVVPRARVPFGLFFFKRVGARRRRVRGGPVRRGGPPWRRRGGVLSPDAPERRPVVRPVLARSVVRV